MSSQYIRYCKCGVETSHPRHPMCQKCYLVWKQKKEKKMKKESGFDQKVKELEKELEKKMKKEFEKKGTEIEETNKKELDEHKKELDELLECRWKLMDQISQQKKEGKNTVSKESEESKLLFDISAKRAWIGSLEYENREAKKFKRTLAHFEQLDLISDKLLQLDKQQLQEPELSQKKEKLLQKLLQKIEKMKKMKNMTYWGSLVGYDISRLATRYSAPADAGSEWLKHKAKKVMEEVKNEWDEKVKEVMKLPEKMKMEMEQKAKKMEQKVKKIEKMLGYRLSMEKQIFVEKMREKFGQIVDTKMEEMGITREQMSKNWKELSTSIHLCF